MLCSAFCLILFNFLSGTTPESDIRRIQEYIHNFKEAKWKECESFKRGVMVYVKATELFVFTDGTEDMNAWALCVKIERPMDLFNRFVE